MIKNKTKINGWTPTGIGSLKNKTYLITGANSGVGFAATEILLSKSARVVMLNRSEAKSKAAIKKLKEKFGSDTEISFILTDLASLAEVRRASKEVLKQVPKIDALICNAAIVQVPEQTLTIDGFESMLGTNHYGHFLLCGLLFPRIEKSEGRIVVVTSLGYKMGLKTIQFDDINWDKNYHQNRTYSQSKLAQMMFAFELQDRLAASNKKSVKVLVCHPGSAKTSLIETSGNLTTKIIFRSLCLTPMVQTAERGSWPSVMCATETNLDQRALYGPTGRMEWIGPIGKGKLEPYAYDKDVMSKLWLLSEQKTGLTWQI